MKRAAARSETQKELEAFWAGEFGDSYVDRNRSERMLASNLGLFSRALSRTRRVRSVVEFGANIGMNLRAIRQLLPEAELSAVEINEKAVRELRSLGYVQVSKGSLYEFTPKKRYDLVLVKGVLIHLDPASLPQVYEILHQSTERYLLLGEYYSPTPAEVSYRGHPKKLFKRDFAGELLERYPDWHLLDYGFVYRLDPVLPADDIHWFLLEKGGRSWE